MSSKRGDCKRTRAQKHKNRTVFKNDLHDKSTRTKALNAMNINEVCQKCHDVIEWKIKYRKYKALTAPASCTYCHERKVKKAYHVLCRDCSVAKNQCAKCLTSGAEVEIIPPDRDQSEKLRLSVEMKQMIKMLPERKRRTFMRFMNGKKKREKNAEGNDEDEGQEEPQDTIRTRDELLEKIEELKCIDVGEGDEDGEDDDDSWDSEDFSSAEEGSQD